MAFTVPNTFVARTKAKAAKVNENFTAFKAKFGSNTALVGSEDLRDVALINNTKHGNLGTAAADTYKHDADEIGVVDADAHFLAQPTNTELALKQLAVAVGMASGVATGGAVNAKYGVIAVRGVATTGVLTDFSGGGTQAFNIATASGEIYGYMDTNSDEAAALTSFLYGLQVNISSDLVVEWKVNALSTVSAAALWIYVNGTKEFTVTTDGDGEVTSIANDGSGSSSVASGVGTMTLTITAADDIEIEYISKGRANGIYIMSLTSLFLDDAKVSKIRPYRQY